MRRTGHAQDDGSPLAPLVRAIHAAGVDASLWPEVLQGLRERLGAQVVTLIHHEFLSGANATLFESPGDLAFGDGLAEYAARNPWFLSSGEYLPGRVMTGSELIGEAELRRTDFYRGFLRPRGLLHLLCGVVDQRDRGAHVLAAYRAEAQAPFDGREKSELAQLLAHVTLSLHGQWRWQEANDLAAALLRLSDHDPSPSMLVTGDAQVLYRNRAAEQLQQGLRMEGNRVVAASGPDRRLLGEAIARVARDDAESAAAKPAVLTMASVPPLPPVVVVLRPVGPVFSHRAGRPRGLVMLAVRGGHAAHDPATCVFARQYELTTAQARVSALVFAGQSLGTIAQSLGLSENTVRSHLKQIFQKTDTHGQMELVHLHARVCPTLP